MILKSVNEEIKEQRKNTNLTGRRSNYAGAPANRATHRINLG